MEKRIQEKIDKYKKAAKSQPPLTAEHVGHNTADDSLSKVIRTKKDADNFMNELDRLTKNTK
jgi:hypothetical protein